tara:strand:+ start:94 stop:486 length:393 start_codon:yes stop_codon:yes gene_type:complete
MINYIIPNYISQFQPQPSMLDFDDLDFKPHRFSDGVQAKLELGNGLGISVVANNDGGDGLYGKVSDDLYEVAIFSDDGMIPLSPSDDVVGWQSPQQVSHLMAKAQSEGSVWVDELEEAKAEFRRELDLDN